MIDFLFVPGRAWVGGWSFLEVQKTLADLYSWSWRLLLTTAGVGAVVALLRRAMVARTCERPPSTDVTTAGSVVCA